MLKLGTIAVIMAVLLSAPAAAGETGYEKKLALLEKRFELTYAPLMSAPTTEKQEMTCLALNVYFEARGTIHRQQEGVAWVARNRAEVEVYNGPNICDVVFQKRGKTAQFAWTAHPLNRVYVDDEGWSVAQEIAYGVYMGTIPDPTKGALAFHEVKLPKKYRKYAAKHGLRIGSHVFYGWMAKL